MAKIKTQVSKAASGNSTAKPNNQHRKAKKKRLFWNKKVKQAKTTTEEESKPAVCLPPKTPQEVSCNWKTLQELLKQKATAKDAIPPAPGIYSKKKHAAKEGANPKTSTVNGTGKILKAGPVEKPKQGHLEALAPPTVAKSKRPALGNSQAQRSGKEHKGSGKRCNTEREQEDIKRRRRKTEQQVEPKVADIWFDDVDPDDIEAALGPEVANIARKNLGIKDDKPQQQPAEQALVKEKSFEGLTRAVAMDCEMVGVGPDGEDSVVARVSVVNLFGKCVYDKYVKPTEKVSDYRTAVSGIRPDHLKTGEAFKVVQKEVADILRGRILVGHALHNDLKVLFLDHPKKNIRDTQRYKPFRQQVMSGRPSLKQLCEKLLNVRVQTSEHSSIQDAQAAMRLYTMAKKDWEASLKAKRKAKKE